MSNASIKECNKLLNKLAYCSESTKMYSKVILQMYATGDALSIRPTRYSTNFKDSEVEYIIDMQTFTELYDLLLITEPSLELITAYVSEIMSKAIQSPGDDHATH